MGSPAAAPVVVREVWHARGELLGDDLVSLVSVLSLGGSAVLHADNYKVHLPRATIVTLAGYGLTARGPAATTVKWRRLVETRLRTLLVMIAREGHRWGDGARWAEVPIPVDGDSSDEGLPASDHSESDGSADDASSNGGWSSESDQGGGGGVMGENLTIFALRVATLNLRGYQRKKTEVLASALGHKVDVLALTEIRSGTQGTVEGEDHDLWESGAKGAEGKALMVHTGG